MTKITWAKAPRTKFWSGAIGCDDYRSRFAYGITMAKPHHAPTPRQSRRYVNGVMTRTKWKFEYTLTTNIERENGFTYRVGGRYATLEAAQAAAFDHLTNIINTAS